MERLLRQLAQDEGGKRFLVNLWQGMHTDQVPVRPVRRLLEAVLAAPKPSATDDWHPYLATLREVIFDDPDAYQFVGPRAYGGHGRWMTVKSASDLVELVRTTSGRPAKDLEHLFYPVKLTEPLHGRPDDTYRVIAEVLSESVTDLKFLLARVAFPASRAGVSKTSPRAVPVWLSRWCSFEEAFPDCSLPSPKCAGRIRDWLGLTHYGVDVPLFAIRMRGVADSSTLPASRPTVLDGFNHPMFKHRTAETYDAEHCGTATDLDLIDKPPSGPGDLDGGPEVVSQSIWYDPTRFECAYVGKTPRLPFYPFGNFHSRLIGIEGDLDSIVGSLIDTLRVP